MALDPMLLLILAALLYAAGHLATAAIWPYRACKRCSGGKRRSPNGKAWRSCRICGGSGKRVRAGRHVLDWIREHRR